MAAYYNEIDTYAAAWLRNLIKKGLIADGVVDTRSIVEVEPNEIKEFTQCHFFAGIGVWSLALRNAGWPDDRPVWTGSCPCQPFSTAGGSAGFADERHLWPHFYHLIRERKPTVVFGEQVASKIAENWFDLVSTDLEALGFAVGAVAFPSAGVGAPHIRDRLYWVGDSAGEQWVEGLQPVPTGQAERTGSDSESGIWLGDSIGAGLQEHGRHGQLYIRQLHGAGKGRPDTDSSMVGVVARRGEGDSAGDRTGPVNGFWRNSDWISCRDNKWRPVRSGAFPLVDGSTSRVGRLRAYGNAINAEAAREFIGAFLDSTVSDLV